jgi:hypothetical protein
MYTTISTTANPCEQRQHELSLKLDAEARYNRELVECLRRWLVFSVAVHSPDGSATHKQMIEQRLREAREATARVLA